MNRKEAQYRAFRVSNFCSPLFRSDIFTEDLEGLLEARHELAHISQKSLLVGEPVAHLTLQVLHEPVCLVRSLALEVLQERVGHVGALGKHIVKVTEALLS